MPQQPGCSIVQAQGIQLWSASASHAEACWDWFQSCFHLIALASAAFLDDAMIADLTGSMPSQLSLHILG